MSVNHGLQAQAGRWHKARFPNAQCEHVLLKSMEELGETADAWNAIVGLNSSTTNGTTDEFVKECADTVISLLVAVDRYTDEDLMAYVSDKLHMLLTPGAHKSGLIK